MRDTDDDLRDLYQEVIFDHNRNPRNFHALDDASNRADGHNPLCGDQLTVYARVQDGVVQEVSFIGHGCAISTASASLMTEAVRGMRVDEVDVLFRNIHAMLTEAHPDCDLGKLEVLSGVREFPSRVKCATLAWHTLHNAITQAQDTAVTE
ncbi:Fe-S cluster assembly sulfur transfer protein SufU [Castellaniella sp.]|uniref:Fe-S cluster assembly sulfur transfer protein SufU n=1 Tax=Castellaniella sp. TaxID=1955812 RepID=UPI002AFF0E6E|nr:SUF system NifU family Fe-S cluster assembly protein [Castellaniella sp.]